MIYLSDISGFVASALVLATFAMTNMRLLRITAILSNVAFIAYGSVNALLPVLVLHVLLLPLNLYRLGGSAGSREAHFGKVRRNPDRATEMAIEALHLGIAMRERGNRHSACRPPHFDRPTRQCVN